MTPQERAAVHDELAARRRRLGDLAVRRPDDDLGDLLLALRRTE